MRSSSMKGGLSECEAPRPLYGDEWELGPRGLAISEDFADILREGQELLRHGRHREAIQSLHEHRLGCSLDDCKTRIQQCGLVSLLLGIAYRKYGRFGRAEEYVGHSIAHFSETGDLSNHSRGILALGDVYRARALRAQPEQKVDALWSVALKQYEHSRRVFSALDSQSRLKPTNQVLLAQILWAHARVWTQQHTETNRAYRYLMEAWRISKENQAEWAQEECAQLIGRLMIKRGELGRASWWIHKSYRLARRSGNVDRMVENLLYLGRIAQESGKRTARIRAYGKQVEKLVRPLVDQDLPKEHQFYDFLRQAQDLIACQGDSSEQPHW